MWNKLAARELVEAYRCLKAAEKAPLEIERAANGWQLNGWNRAEFLGEANACFARAKRYRDKVRGR